MASDRPSTLVLVHGAWGGAHTWRSVRPPLWAAGHQVFTPSLTGIGERVHLTGPHVDLTVHVDDVVNTILFEDLADITLVGFSYGGMVVTGCLQHVADRVRHLVYLDAFVPTDGQSLGHLTAAAGSGQPVPTTRGPGDQWLVEPRDRTFDDPAEAEFAATRRTAQPLRTFTEPVRLPQPLDSYPFSRSYVKALGDPRKLEGPDAFWDAADRARHDPAWQYFEHPSNHMIPQNDPLGVAEPLRGIAAG
jgi:pimeloyl-ACP methyl ester carboxylesterase